MADLKHVYAAPHRPREFEIFSINSVLLEAVKNLVSMDFRLS